MLKKFIYFFTLILSFAAFAEKKKKDAIQTPKSFTWKGSMVHLGLGNVFDFELDKNKGDGRPTSAMFKYGYEYGFLLKNRYFLSLGLDWTIIYPRNFEELDNGFFEPNVTLWYLPLTNISLGYAPSEDWLVTLGLIYYWGTSFSVRYKVKDFMFVETRGVVWMDRVFNTGGAYGGGFDNLHWSAGVGFFL